MTVSINMPHRFCVRYDDGRRQLEFEVEPLSGGMLFYAADPKLVAGEDLATDDASAQVETWLRAKFQHVEVDHSPKPSF